MISLYRKFIFKQDSLINGCAKGVIWIKGDTMAEISHSLENLKCEIDLEFSQQGPKSLFYGS